jgi:hypothetical protein
MSAECWMFEVDQPLPFWPNRWITINVRYIGPDWENWQDTPSTDLLSIKQHLEIYAIYGIEEWCDEDAGIRNFYTELKTFLSLRENDLLTLIIKDFEETKTIPLWYWDT